MQKRLECMKSGYVNRMMDNMVKRPMEVMIERNGKGERNGKNMREGDEESVASSDESIGLGDSDVKGD